MRGVLAMEGSHFPYSILWIPFALACNAWVRAWLGK